ncbi:hypothetical protein QBC40DRAFT_334474 [Triangularia verruculosa]|uniref:Uncharacterized protein n=1 Tax=Triangularia verruculosa TaxID=2587418 RepID=A0AAN6XBM3_9PEZI|nr:hypothetical protein QBC40DRAFT_334474 [Triangularia verruculosa]
MADQLLIPSTIVGVDLGTTFSSIAWASTASPDDVNVLRKWPSFEGVEEASRVPTKVTTQGKWGFDIPLSLPENEVMQWFKLGLYPWVKSAPPRYFEELKKNTSPEALIQRYLTALLTYAKGQMDLVSLPDDYEYVVTVPAVWSNDSKEKTKTLFSKAAKEAGMPEGTVHLLSEPEAAAIHVLSEKAEASRKTVAKLKIGDTFVVCDVGGGTVDLITYTVTNVSPLEVKEAAPGDGEVAGSAQLNMRFEAYLEARFAKAPTYTTSSETLRKRIVQQAVTQFEKTKRRFDQQSLAVEFPVSLLPDCEEAGIKNGRFRIEAEHLEDIFKPTVSAIVEVVQKQILQITTAIQAVVLVGGFSQSPYLFNSLRAAVHPSIRFIRPPHPELAVTYGAIKKGLSLADDHGLTKVRVTSRKARHHIGDLREHVYNEKRHRALANKAYWCGYSGYTRVSAMTWYHKRGDDLPENKSVSFPFYQKQLVGRGWYTDLTLVVKIDRNDRPAGVALDEKVGDLCTLTADLTGLADCAHTFVKKGEDGKLYYVLDGDIRVTHRSADMEYVLYIEHKRYDQIEIKYDYC